jgi:carboxyl-terminal processing protease
MRRLLILLTATACASILVVGLVIVSYTLGARQSSPEALTALSASTDATDLPPSVEELYDQILTNAVAAPDGDELVRAALEAMLEELDDPYALYYDSEEFADFNELLEGRFSGVGLALEDTPEGPTVVTVFPGTPAEAAGIEVGERIVSVNGEDVTGSPIEVIVNRVTGEPGTDVTVGFDGGSQGSREVTMTRAEIELPTVEAELLDDGSGVVRLFSFSSNASEAVRTEVEQLVEQGAEGIILDLRGNPGGLLSEAVEVSSVFVEGEDIVQVREADGELRTLTAGSDAFTDLPLVVLVDEGSASASEIVAGAMQDLDRGPIVGTPTFGKGTVQTVRDLTDGSGAKFTTAEYLTPSGDSIEGTGVQPDVATGEDPDEQLTAAREQLQRLVARGGS